MPEVPPPFPAAEPPAPNASPPPAGGPLPAPAPIPALPGLPGTGAGLLRLAVGFYGIVTLFALGFALFSGHLGDVFGDRAPSLVGLLGAAGMAGGLVALSRMGVNLWKPMAEAADELGSILGPVSVRDGILLALLSGFAEELLFRGALWFHLGLVGSAFLFGLVHVLPRRRLWVYPVFAAVAGLLLGLLREGTGSVVPPMLCHAVVNGANLVWLGQRARRRAAPPAA